MGRFPAARIMATPSRHFPPFFESF